MEKIYLFNSFGHYVLTFLIIIQIPNILKYLKAIRLKNDNKRFHSECHSEFSDKIARDIFISKINL